MFSTNELYRKVDDTIDKSNVTSVKENWKSELKKANDLVDEILDVGDRETVKFILNRDEYTRDDILALKSIFKRANQVG